MAVKPGAADTQAYEFGPYRLERGKRRLLRNGEPISLTPKAFDTLLALIERHDRVVDKAELMKLVWPDSFVEEANLSQTIFVLRKTLGEGPDGRPYIDTVPRRGYRFGAEVRGEGLGPPVAAERIPSWRARAPWVALAAMVAAVLVWFGTSRMLGGADTTAPIESLVVLPFGNLSGDAAHDYLADGLTDALITNLGQISGLRVISRTSAIPARPCLRLRES
jgi:DNA-binding winged helix-turn-helix (wHTH) protein